MTINMENIEKYIAEENSDNSPKGTNALHAAADYLDIEAIKYLINEKKYNINAENIYKYTALHVTVSSADSPKTIKVILEAGANTEVYSTEVGTPLHIAAQKGHYETAKILLEHGANATALNSYSQTPLELAKANFELNFPESHIQLMEADGYKNIGENYINTIALLENHTKIKKEVSLRDRIEGGILDLIDDPVDTIIYFVEEHCSKIGIVIFATLIIITLIKVF